MGYIQNVEEAVAELQNAIGNHDGAVQNFFFGPDDDDGAEEELVRLVNEAIEALSKKKNLTRADRDVVVEKLKLAARMWTDDDHAEA